MSSVIASVSVRNVDASKCPFSSGISFVLRKGELVWMTGPSGVGKSTIGAAVCGLIKPQTLRRELGMTVDVEWTCKGTKCGALFQSTTLIDTLSVEANVCLALDASGFNSDIRQEAKRLLEAVGLHYVSDGPKAVTELSGGMGRRASLALQLAQRKAAIVLDEPFAGLDIVAASTVARELRRVREDTALLLIEHQQHLVELVGLPNTTCDLQPAGRGYDTASSCAKPFAYRLSRRCVHKFRDYVWLSLPLVLCGLGAAGLAVSMLSADLLTRLDVLPYVDAVVDDHVLPLVETLLGKDVSPLTKAMTMAMVKTKSRTLVDDVLPPARRVLYAAGLAKLYVLEVGPLLCGLLLAGRLGGSYSGEVATMQATDQNSLLLTLQVNPRRYTLLPALAAALLSVPLLSITGTLLALALSDLVGRAYFQSGGWFWPHVRDATFPTMQKSFTCLDFATWPPVHHLLKSLSFAVLIIIVAEHISRRKHIKPRTVPHAITASVVGSSLMIIFADWLFSQLLILKHS